LEREGEREREKERERKREREREREGNAKKIVTAVAEEDFDTKESDGEQEAGNAHLKHCE
jgi:hypothetical protein